MNLRQKAKKLKRDNNYLRDMIIATRGVHMPSVQKSIVTLQASQIVSPDIADCNVNQVIAANLLHQILDYAEITKEPYYGDREIIRARIKVVDMN